MTDPMVMNCEWRVMTGAYSRPEAVYPGFGHELECILKWGRVLEGSF